MTPRRAVLVASGARHLDADPHVLRMLARCVDGAELAGVEVVAILDAADGVEAHRMVADGECDLIIATCPADLPTVQVGVIDNHRPAANGYGGPDVPARRRRPQPVVR